MSVQFISDQGGNYYLYRSMAIRMVFVVSKCYFVVLQIYDKTQMADIDKVRTQSAVDMSIIFYGFKMYPLYVMVEAISNISNKWKWYHIPWK